MWPVTCQVKICIHARFIFFFKLKKGIIRRTSSNYPHIVTKSQLLSSFHFFNFAFWLSPNAAVIFLDWTGFLPLSPANVHNHSSDYGSQNQFNLCSVMRSVDRWLLKFYQKLLGHLHPGYLSMFQQLWNYCCAMNQTGIRDLWTQFMDIYI